jgi:eukaryotic-like serine/threonine-protein kinase
VLHREAVDRARKEGSASSRAIALYWLGRNLMSQKRWADAEPVLRESLADRETQQTNTWLVFDTRVRLGTALMRQGKWEESESHLTTSYWWMYDRRANPAAPFYIPNVADYLIELYSRWGKPDEAAKWRAERAKYPTVAPPPRAKP